MAKQQHKSGDHDSTQDCAIKTEDAETFSVCVFFLAEEPGDHGTSTESEDITEGDHQSKNRCAERDACHKIGVAGTGDKVSIYHIIDQGNHHTEHHWECHRKKGFRHGSLFKNFIFHWGTSFNYSRLHRDKGQSCD